ncbi:glycosyltransferase involved in cell wall biosynthesis [Paenibacillus forsythiae]|uniref:Glycosyltransferase involved in cell wall biosynthesis n=1 Tax=Paenibacillus forsythiae TaxID=365616 RepID=A0ABU3HC16_9BACL|nr:glycosyltransferase family 4 protein [Paenibacillus forsythiae]MDT3428366.1 glycosyltransferase involved in cell wall biosynthesis [Paenibacillus forsythiae]
MRILQVAPNHETVPPPRDGGTERIIYELSQELVKRGHEVILFAPNGSYIWGSVIPYPFYGDDAIASYVVENLPENIDIIHDHTFDSALSRIEINVPVVHTIHLPVYNPVYFPIYVSRSARETIGGGYGFDVNNGIVVDEYEFSHEKGDFLLFMGRIVREKGVLQAMDLAEMTGQRLVIAGPIHDEEMFIQEVTPRLNRNSLLQYVGPVGGRVRQDLLKYARCLLFPIQWEEPFGLVLIEAMACGTPVLAMAKGAVPEILEPFPEMMCDSFEEMAGKLYDYQAPYLPEKLRYYVGERFSVSRMVDRYLYLYQLAISGYWGS